MKPPRPCKAQGCRILVERYWKYCARHTTITPRVPNMIRPQEPAAVPSPVHTAQGEMNGEGGNNL